MSTLSATVVASTGGGSVFFPRLPSLEHILVDGDGRHHVVLRANGAAIQLTVHGADITTQPVAITFGVHGLEGIAAGCAQFAALHRILGAPMRVSTARPLWTATRRKLRNAFITMDGKAAGASYHEIAVVLYGLDYVQRNWKSGLKQHMQRHFRRGLRFATGGYRDDLR